ncbi:glycosyl transferase family 2 [Sinomonas atrocyanea]|uniref:Glycosyl transferase family 2 n=1 Tax=Sinomonas atrocyanea TaxID=37927 RepID=A0A127A257_9MICC|nr:glycosyltransferase family 2 protein [Sinomonas atrocyanea]AMM33548.1 glycosyl transferase family 2 [Sinomonas atrocyanea]GEB66299.1 glycosyl transferase [Sinomonas atrocyanea]GGG77887.1 glycosyl transferase [Sinomonas atrocyanea]
MTKIPATVLILTKNEEASVQRAVESAKPFDEVIVVDSGSTDKTQEVARRAGATVVEYLWDGAYPKKKEWSLSAAQNDWVVYLDADEFFPDDLVEEIAAVLVDPTASAFEVPLQYYWMGKRLAHGHQVRKRIGMRRSRCQWPRPNDLHVEHMWEVEGHYQPRVLSGRLLQLSKPLGHDDRDGLYDYFARHNRYSDWEAHMLVDRDAEAVENRSTLGRIAAKLPAKPLIFFIYSYIIRRGFLDGTSGFHYAAALSFYYWQIGVKMSEIRRRDASAVI